jgi:patatin-related protein
MSAAQPDAVTKQPDAVTKQPASELRLAVTFTGGVSLAVWMGGMAREINLLLAASRIRRGESVADTTEQGRRVRAGYGALLDLLNLDCSMDVLSGTSAGGINAVILGLANVQRFDLDGLRKLWFAEGSLTNLLRDPADKQVPTSLLYGDKSLLQGLSTGLKDLAHNCPGNPHQDSDPTQVFITTTLLSGEASTFTDTYGTLVRDVDHHGLFKFTSEQLTPANVPALALAARCSASFPVAFEPALVPIGVDGGDGHPDMHPFTAVQVTQFAADGGMLANQPLGPALQAVFDRPADRDVRRVLAFVVPVLGGAGLPKARPTVADTPDLAGALKADMGAMMSQTISGDLATITAHNQQVRARNDTRQQLALLAAHMQQRLGAPFWAAYRAQRASSVARAAAGQIMNRTAAGPRATDLRPAGFGADADHALDAAHNAAAAQLPLHLPGVGVYDPPNGMNAAGREALDDGKVTVLAMLSRAFELVPAAQKPDLGRLREQANAAMPDRPEQSHADTVRRVLREAPQAPGPPTDTGRAVSAAMAARALLSANMAVVSARQPWLELGTVVVELRRLLPPRDVAASTPGDSAGNGAAPSEPDAASSDAAFVWDLLDYLTDPNGVDQADAAAARLFDLHVARYVMQPEELLADQALELVAMTSDTRTSLDRRTLAREKLTGLQLHNFSAFYKASWRANDWMWGRLDGAGWLVHVLLDPRRLLQLATEAPDRNEFLTDLRTGLQKVAGSQAPPGVWGPFPSQGGQPGAAAEMSFLNAADPPAPPTSLPITAMWVAAGLQRLIAAEELPNVAEQIDNDGRAKAQEPRAARDFVTAYCKATGAANGSYPVVPDADAARLLTACKVSDEKLADEIGSGLFAATVTRAAAVSIKAVGASKALPLFLRPVVAGARTVTSLAYRVACSGPAARYPAFAGLGLVALGVLASTSTINVLSAAGLAALLAGLLLIAVGTRRIVPVLAIIAVAAGAALTGAAYIPFVRARLFSWLEKTAVPSLAKHPAEWAILVLFVLLPPLWTIAIIIKRRPRSQATVPTEEPTTDTLPDATVEPAPGLAGGT